MIVWRNLPRFTLLCIILIIIVFMGAISKEKARIEKEKAASQSQGRKPVNAVLLSLHPTIVKDAINLPGFIEAWVQLELIAKISGSIDEVLVQEGSVVEKGQVLARIEADDYRIALETAKAAYQLAQNEYERDKVMLRKKIIPVSNLDMSETQLRIARAAMEEAELKLSRCTITAPMNGIVRRLDAKVGLFLSIGDPVAEILQIDRVKAIIGIPESDVAAVRTISEVVVTIKALGNRAFKGKKLFLSPAPDSAAHLYRLELELENEKGDILPGMFLRAHVIKSIVHDALTIPLYSIITRNNEQFVFVANDGIVQKRQVELGIIEKWQVQITEGLQAGDKVVIEGHRDVEDGQQVRVIQEITDLGSLQL